MTIAKAASRDVAFEAAKMNESVFKGQSDTLVSVSPEINTKILDEIDLSELEELVRRLSRNK